MIIILGGQHVGIINIHDALAFQPSAITGCEL